MNKDNKSSIDTQDSGLAFITSLINNPTEEKPDNSEVGMLRIKTANQWMQEAATRPDPTPLWDCLWHEGEMACLFADSNLGKSIYAVQIADKVSKLYPTLYYDFELSDKQFQVRNTGEFGMLHEFPSNMFRAEIDPELMGADNFEEAIMDSIEKAALAINAKILIIDNITYLDSETEKGDAAGRLMMRLVHIKKKYGFSILVIAHTPKRNMANPITQNDLAGSKKLFNFFDAVIAIGRSARDESLRYIKQLKARYGEIKYGASNVIVAEITKEEGFLSFKIKGNAEEKEHLRQDSERDEAKTLADVKEMREAGKTIREIADELGLSKSKVGRVIKKLGE